ncbi:MAG: adenylate/guanylate cyclase domain-containing protein, partial [Acidimicrobiales bacterium]|nr:adenylate/guanylate cyclase domain-containing protein [Acidimicrobiales bacterium]
DIVGSVALSERLGPAADDEMRRDHFAALRDAIAAHDGVEVKNMGDGLFAAFPSGTRAVEAAIAIQQRMRGGDVTVRVGVHVGEPVLEEGDYFGKPVAVARRLCDAASGGQILVSDVVRGVSRSPEDCVDPEPRVLKGMQDATVVWRVAWERLA